jgi:hypothetical protein
MDGHKAETARIVAVQLRPQKASCIAGPRRQSHAACAYRYLEAPMTTAPYEYTSEFALRYVNDGMVKGAAKSVLKVLDARGVDLTSETRERISQCRDVDQLDLWLTRVAVATTSDDLFR